MSLIALKQHLSQVKITTLADICQNFNNEDPECMRAKLQHWVRKSQLRCFKKTALCGNKCNKCDLNSTEIYEWIDSSQNNKNSDTIAGIAVLTL